MLATVHAELEILLKWLMTTGTGLGLFRLGTTHHAELERFVHAGSAL